MHLHAIEDNWGDAVDMALLCSDACHRTWCRENDVEYQGWNGCHEVEFTCFCAQCGVVLPGMDACEHQRSVVMVNRLPCEKDVLCECGNVIQRSME